MRCAHSRGDHVKAVIDQTIGIDVVVVGHKLKRTIPAAWPTDIVPQHIWRVALNEFHVMSSGICLVFA